PPLACSAETRPHSAHRVSPYEAFSTLQPVTTRPAPVTPAAPTRSREYGAWDRSVICAAADRSAGQSIAIAPLPTVTITAAPRVFPGRAPGRPLARRGHSLANPALVWSLR